jgi:drug/metabolite transporter (DMT)-like permease
LNVRRAIAVFFGVLGVFFVTTNLNLQSLGETVVLGDCAVLSSGLVWAFFTVFNKKLVLKSKHLVQPMTWILFATVLSLIPFLALSGNFLFQLSLEAWLAIVYTAVACWVIPYYLWSEGLKSISPVSSTVILLTEVVVAFAISAVILKDSLSLISGVGAVLVVVAIAFAS